MSPMKNTLPEEVVIVNLVDEWRKSKRAYLETLSCFRTQFESCFRLTIQDHSDEDQPEPDSVESDEARSDEVEESVSVWVDVREGVTAQQLVNLSREFYPIWRATELLGEAGEQMHISLDVLTRLRNSMVAISLPFKKLRQEQSHRLGEAFGEFRTGLRKLYPLLLDRGDGQCPSNEESRQTEVESDETERIAAAVERIEGQLSGQGLDIFRFLSQGAAEGKKKAWHPTKYDKLKLQHHFWRNPDNVSDNTVFEALKALRQKLSDMGDSLFRLENSKRDSRARLLLEESENELKQ